MWKRPLRRSLLVLLFVATGQLAAGRTLLAREDIALAIQGYDPVAYFTVGKAMPGLPEFEHRWDEHRYRFVRAEHLEMFKADPVRYAPQFANFCAMALARGELIEADPANWLVSGGKLYVFAKPAGAALFQQGLAGNIDKADLHWPRARPH